MQVSLRCLSEPFGDQLLDMTRHNCSIGNPFIGNPSLEPRRIQLRVELDPRNEIIGSEEDIFINFTVSSINPENSSTIVDNSNFDVVRLMFEARANISIDDG